MAQVKNHEVERYLKQPNASHRVFLVYGPDAGLVSERAATLAAFSGTDLQDPFSTIVLDADEAAADTQRISDEAHTVPMFGGNRLVWIKGSTQKNLVKAIQPILDQPPVDALVVIEAGDLKKSSPLRARIEASKSAIALPCYQDQAQALQQVIDQEMQISNLSIDSDARQILLSLLGENRMASRGEVQKLCLYAAGSDRICVEDVVAIVGDASVLGLDAVVDAASIGDIATMEHTLKRLVARGTAVFQILNATQRHFQLLHLARSQMDSMGSSAASVIGGLRPPINFQRKDKFTQALSKWKLASLEKVLRRLNTASLETRKNSSLAVPLTTTALLAIAIEARQARFRS